MTLRFKLYPVLNLNRTSRSIIINVNLVRNKTLKSHPRLNAFTKLLFSLHNSQLVSPIKCVDFEGKNFKKNMAQ